MAYRMTAEQWHKRNHNWGRDTGKPMAECWRCQRAQAICKSKRAYPDGRTAAESAHAQNLRENWAHPVYPYPCRWCLNYHLATAKHRVKLKRVEKQRRKWLTRTFAARVAAELEADQ